MRRFINAIALALFFGCGGEPGEMFPEPSDGGAELGSVEQGWTTKVSGTGFRIWGAKENFGNTACTLTQNSSSVCYYHGHNGGDTLDMVVKYWVNPQWVNTLDDIVRADVDTFISNALWVTQNGAQLPWSFQRLGGNTQPADANVIIQAGYASGTLSGYVGQYISVDWQNCSGEQSEPEPIPGTFHKCNTGGAGWNGKAVISFDLDGLESYMTQQGYSAAAKTDTRRHVLWHGMHAELGIGGTNNTINSSTRTLFTPTNRITNFLSSEEICRWRGLTDAIANNGNPGDQANYRVNTNSPCN